MTGTDHPSTAERLIPWALAAAAGVVLALALPGLGWLPLVLVFPGLLLEALGRTRSGLRAALLGLFAGVCHWVVATNWVVPVMHHYGGLPLAAAVVCVVLMAAILGVAWAVVAWVTWQAPPAARLWLLPVAWIALESARNWPPWIFPWNPTAAAAAEHPWLLASLPVWGASGLGWAMVAAGAGLWGLVRTPARRFAAAAVVAPVLLVAVLSAVAPRAVPAGDPARVAVLQPGTSLEEKWDPQNWQEIASNVWRLTHQAAAEGAELVFWPESAIPFSIERDPEYRAQVTALAAELDLTIVLNSVGGRPDGGWANSAFVVTARGLEPERYDKIRLVPFGEYVPFWARVAFAEALVREVGNFTPGDDPDPLPTEPPVGMSICYEVVYADLVSAEVRRGAELLATITNDGWYGFSWAPEQHFAQAVLRAAETRRPLVRAALTGISGVVDPDGRVRDRLPVGATGVLTATVQPTRGLTPRTRWRDWWAALCALATFATVLHSRRHPSPPVPGT